MEKGLYLTDYNMLQNNLTEFNYIYYGNEFCMSRYICFDGLCKVIEYCKKYKKTVCLLTPYIPDHYMEYMVNLLDRLLQYDVKIELIINDYGLMYLIYEKYKNQFILTCGRLLNRKKKSPNMMNYFKKFNQDSQIAMQTNAINNGYSFDILKQFGIVNVQYDNAIQGNYISSENKFNKHLLYPYVYISTSRRCIGTSINGDSYFFNSLCDKSCDLYTYTLYNADVKQEIILNGNTIQYINDDIPENLHQFSRIIYNGKSHNDIDNMLEVFKNGKV